MIEHEVGSGRRFVVGDVVEVLDEYQQEAAAIFLDDAWARPQRRGQFGVEYSTHPFDAKQEYVEDNIDTSITTTEIIDACFETLVDGGWLICDGDDWLLPRLINHLQDEWGDVAQTYKGGGYRKTGGVTYVKSDGTPDCSTPGMYLSNGGYPVIFAHKGETDRRTSASARQLAERKHDRYNWGSVKPATPYEGWVEGLVEPDELVLVPCAGTAPAAIATERVFGDEVRYVCIDNEEKAYEAFLKRREDEIPTTQQKRLSSNS